MLSREVGCFRFSRRLVRVWRWIFRGRLRRYRRLEHHRSPLLAPARRLLRWIRSLRRRLCATSICGGGNEGLKRLMLEGEGKPPPKGHLVVYVGAGEKDDEPPQRYFVPVLYFNHPLFRELLKEAEEKFGFHYPRGIIIPCPARQFERIQNRIAACCAVDRRESGRRIYWCF